MTPCAIITMESPLSLSLSPQLQQIIAMTLCYINSKNSIFHNPQFCYLSLLQVSTHIQFNCIEKHQTMCMNTSPMTPGSPQFYAFRLRRPSKQHNVRVHRLINRERKSAKVAMGAEKAGENRVEMEMKNLKLYMENQIIIEENNKLRKKALFLVQENQALFSQLKQKQPISKQNSANNLNMYALAVAVVP